MKGNELINRIITAFRKDRRLSVLAVSICVAAILLFMFTGNNTDKTETVSIDSVSATEAETEDRLSAVLSEIRGAGRVKVMITYDTTAELVPAMSSSRQSGESEQNGATSRNDSEQNQLATVNNGGEQEPVVLTQIQPKVRGVIIIAEGAADISVRLNLEYAAATVLGISTDAIEVFEMRG